MYEFGSRRLFAGIGGFLPDKIDTILNKDYYYRVYARKVVKRRQVDIRRNTLCTCARTRSCKVSEIVNCPAHVYSRTAQKVTYDKPIM
jgi:hypothetical protein